MQSLKELYKIGHGPSSSHTIGAERACLYIKNNYNNINRINIILYGSLALTGKGHLTDVIINKTLNDIPHDITFDCETIKIHPNAIDFNIEFNDKKKETVTIYSIGGGTISINGLIPTIDNKVYPFKSFEEIKKYCLDNKISLAEVVYRFENEDIKEYLKNIYDVMEDAINRGLHEEGFLPGKLHLMRKAKQLYNQEENAQTDFIRLLSSYAFAVSEENANGKLIVTAPTCGACGVLPSVLKYIKDKENLDEDKIIDALAVAGLIGNVVKENAAISGAYAGCQSEIGTACSMAAAATSFLFNRDIEEIEYAAEIALEHHLGLTCDPIGGLVQIPCIERNAVAAIRAIDSSQLAKFLHGTRRVSFDTVVKTMYETGKDLNSNYKETSIGGLAKNFSL